MKAAAAGEAIEADHGPGGFAGITEFFDIGKPVIAAINGLALGGWFELALAADLVVAADHAEFALTEVTLGLVADAGGLLRLPARLPRAIAVEYLLTGRRIPAVEAADWGLVNRVVPAAELMTAARGLADAICAAAPLAVAAVLEILRETEGGDVRTGYSLLRSGSLPAYGRMLGSRDAREGVRRAPHATVGGRINLSQPAGAPCPRNGSTTSAAGWTRISSSRSPRRPRHSWTISGSVSATGQTAAAACTRSRATCASAGACEPVPS